jgi:hypothetical protein
MNELRADYYGLNSFYPQATITVGSPYGYGNPVTATSMA